MLKALIFDLNGVLVQGPFLSERFKDKYGAPVDVFLPALKEIMAKVRKPEAGDAFLYWQPYFAKWGLKIEKQEFFNFWFKAEKEAPEIIEMARVVKARGLKLFILSNNFEERAIYCRDHFSFIHDIFDNVYYSWQTGFVKPDPRAFTNLLFVNGLTPEECLYIDNTEENIGVARDIGMNAEIYTDTAGLKKTLTSFGAL
ncbi:MAG: HAD-IA family hydrolase [bacterium]